MTSPTIAGQLRVDAETLHDGTILVVPYGELDIASASRLERRLLRAEAARPPQILIDLRELEFIDSSGLNVLLAARRRSDTADHALVLLRGSHAVQRLLELTGTEHVLIFLD